MTYAVVLCCYLACEMGSSGSCIAIKKGRVLVVTGEVFMVTSSSRVWGHITVPCEEINGNICMNLVNFRTFLRHF